MVSGKEKIIDLIKDGENQHLDFKFEISDSAKIARSLSAFANTDGGKLLIGVKDNGKISGITSEEEYYMVENAALNYCKPRVKFSTREWNFNGKKVLEVTIPKSPNVPHRAPDQNGKYKAYIRFEDKNILAQSILLKVWEIAHSNEGSELVYSNDVKEILNLFSTKNTLELNEIIESLNVSKYKAEKIIVQLVALKVLDLQFDENYAFLTLNDNLENEK